MAKGEREKSWFRFSPPFGKKAFIHIITLVLTFGLSLNDLTVHPIAKFVGSNDLELVLGPGIEVVDLDLSGVWWVHRQLDPVGKLGVFLTVPASQQSKGRGKSWRLSSEIRVQSFVTPYLVGLFTRSTTTVAWKPLNGHRKGLGAGHSQVGWCVRSRPLDKQLGPNHDGGHFIVNHTFIDTMISFAKTVHRQFTIVNLVSISGQYLAIHLKQICYQSSSNWRSGSQTHPSPSYGGSGTANGTTGHGHLVSNRLVVLLVRPSGHLGWVFDLDMHHFGWTITSMDVVRRTNIVSDMFRSNLVNNDGAIFNGHDSGLDERIKDALVLCPRHKLDGWIGFDVTLDNALHTTWNVLNSLMKRDSGPICVT